MVLCLVDRCINDFGIRIWVIVILCMKLNGFRFVILVRGVFLILISILIGIFFGWFGKFVNCISNLV